MYSITRSEVAAFPGEILKMTPPDSNATQTSAACSDSDVALEPLHLRAFPT